MSDREQLRQRVVEQVGAAWPDFAAAHPALAEVLDHATVGEHISDTLASDPAFQKAYANAAKQTVAADAVAGVVGEFVQRILARVG